MKKTMKNRILSLSIIVVLLTAMLIPMTAFGATKYEIKTLSPGKWATKSFHYDEKSEAYIDTYYKITVSKPGQLAFTLSGDTYITIYNSKSDLLTTSKKYSRKSISPGSVSKLVAVEKGTYYLDVWSGSKCKYSFTAAATPTNYCIAKAKALKANTEARNMFTPKTNFDRWYKITNPKKKKIVIMTNISYYAHDVQIYNANLQIVPKVKNGADTKYCTKTSQKKGTYYIRVRCQSRYEEEVDYAFGDVVTLKWK
ncbi:MAG: hypothetical protein Q4D81_09080 [Eubacteriales bacterium]|nr:hypothetical protein [Eubacteriales bacterium]